MKRFGLIPLLFAALACGQTAPREILRVPNVRHADASAVIVDPADAGQPPADPDAGVTPDAGELVCSSGGECTETPCCGGFYCELSPYAYTFGYCLPVRPDGEFCMNPGECASGVCTDNLCGGITCFAEGEECYGPDRPCCGNLLCDLDVNQYGVGHCVQPRAEGEFCNAHEECATGNCVDNLCAATSPFSFTRVYFEVLVQHNCTNGYCHGSTAGALTMSDVDTTYRNLVGVTAAGRDCSGVMPRVTPWDTENSLLIHKLSPAGEVCGSKMPPMGAQLTEEELALVRGWIAAGAPR